MSNIYCKNCIYMYIRGGVCYCGNKYSDLCDKSVSPDWQKSCDYYKGK